MKRTIALWLAAMFVAVQPCYAVVMVGFGQAAGGGCSETPFFTQDTHESATTLGASTAIYYAGIVNTGASDITMCAIDIYVKETGTLTGKTLYVEKWSVNPGTLVLEAKQADITSIDATTLPAAYAYTNIAFGSNVTISQNQAIVFTLNEAIDASNNVGIAYSSSAAVADQQYRTWRSDLGVGGTATYDLRTKFYGP